MEPPRTLRADARRNRHRVLLAARDIIARDGDDASMRAIAAAAGVGLATVYRQFPTKLDLYEAILAEHVSALGALARAADHDDPGDAFYGFFVDAVEQSTSQSVLLFATLAGVEVAGRMSPAADPELADATRTLLTRAQAAGAVRTDIGMRELNALLSTACAVGERADWDPAVRKAVLGVLLAGLRPLIGPPPARPEMGL